MREHNVIPDPGVDGECDTVMKEISTSQPGSIQMVNRDRKKVKCVSSIYGYK